MKKRREPTAYEADRRYFMELLDRADRRYMPRIEDDPFDDRSPAEKAAETRDLKWGEHRKAMKAHREKLAELEATKPVIVFCTGCGQPRTGTRREMAHFRKCCETSVSVRKYCRGCGVVMWKADYLAKYGNEACAGSARKGWGTYAKCASCGTQHRAGVSE